MRRTEPFVEPETTLESYLEEQKQEFRALAASKCKNFKFGTLEQTEHPFDTRIETSPFGVYSAINFRVGCLIDTDCEDEPSLNLLNSLKNWLEERCVSWSNLIQFPRPTSVSVRCHISEPETVISQLFPLWQVTASGAINFSSK